MLSHTGINAVCESPRNAEDRTIKRIVAAGGLIGVGLFKPALCGDDVTLSYVKSVRHVADLIGDVNSIALGSDWDGCVHVATSPAQTHVLSSALLAIGNFSHAQVEKIMFTNALSFLKRAMPMAES